jgi:4-aminobutyrate aminotransferase-like enzyme
MQRVFLVFLQQQKYVFFMKTQNQILRQQFLAHVGQTSPAPQLITVERAEGVYFYTPEGKRYYDLISGVSVSNVGHANPAVV